jgi:hypothetical protein
MEETNPTARIEIIVSVRSPARFIIAFHVAWAMADRITRP